jgi:hypothetical protein
MEGGQDHSVTSLVEHLFRHEAGRVVSAMTRLFGVHNAVLGQLYLEANDIENARHFITAAGELTSSEAEKKLLNKKLSSLG